MLKKLIGVVSLLTTSSLSIASGISTMTGNASLSDTATNWDPAFVDGNTIVVGVDNISLNANASKTIGAIRLDHDLTINYQTGTAYTFTIGSIAGSGKMTFNLRNDTLNLSGTAGTNNSPLANDYSGFFSIIISNQPTINVNAPVTIGSTFSKTNDTTIKFNFNENTTITDSSFTQISNGEYNISANKLLTLSGSDMTLTSAFNFSDSGQLILSGDNTIFNPSSVSNASSAVLNVDNNVTTSMPSVLTINTINISDGKSFTIDAVNSDIDLLDDNASINFSGSNATLVLTNSGTSDRTFTAYNTVTGNVLFSSDGTLVASKGITGNIDFAGNNGVLQLADNQSITGNVDSTGSSAGTLEFLGKGTVTGSIGATNALTALKFSGAGATNIPAASTETIEIANAGAVVTTTDLLTGNVLFSGDGSLIADKGVDGSITTSTDNTGTITIGSGDVGAIGADGKSLKLVNLDQTAAASAGKLYATTVNIGGVGPITATDLITSAVSFSSDGTLIADKGITGNIDYAGNDGVLQLADSQTITGDVDSTTSSAGTLEFLGKGTVTGSIGATNALTALKFSGAGATNIPAASTETIEIANAGAVVTTTDLLTGNVLFSGDGSLIADKGVDGSITTSTDNTGTITIGSGDVGAIGADGKSLKLVNLDQTAAASAGKLYATTVNIGGVGPITATDLITSAVSFSSDGTLIADKGITGNIDYAGNDGVLQLADSQTITGDVDSTTSSAGTLEFLGKGTVTGSIGATNALTALKFSGAGATNIPAASTETIEIANAGAVVTTTDLLTGNVLFSGDGSLIADKGITGNIDFDSKAASLTFNGDAGDNWYTLDGTISNAGSALLEVDTKLKVIDKGIGGVKTINIGEGGILSIESNEANLALISAAEGKINFTDDDAQLLLSAPQNQTINFAASIAGSDNGGGTILLDGNGYNLTVTLSDDAFLGTNDKKIGAINVSGNVIFDASVDANAASLNINNGAYLTDYSAAAESIDSINIGNEQGAGEYILDARDDDFSINTDNITFKNEDSVLALGSSSVDAERTITLETSIVPSQDKYGVLTLYSTRDKKLTIDNNDDETITIGTAENRLKQLTLSSDGDAEFDIKPTINVESLGLDFSKIDLGEVDANIIFHNNTQYNANGDINGSVDFAGQDGVINVADNANISGSISSTDSASGTLNFLGSSTIGGIVSNISTIQAGAGDVTFSASGDYSIGELQGNGSGTITFPSDMNFTGDVNTSGGEPLNLSFVDNTGVAGNIGSSSSPVGNVSSGNNTQFNGDINSSADVITSGTTVFAGGVTSNNIIANKTSSNMLSLSLTTLTSAFSVSSSNRINFDEANAITQFQGIVNTTGNIEVNGSTYFADTVNSGGNVVINGNTKFNKTLSSNNGISISGGSNVIFNGDVSSSSINIDNANIGVTDNIEVQGDVSASNSSILLDGNTLTLSGTHTFSDQITISSTYDASGLSGGNIILQSGSTLDLSNVSELTIKLAFINSDISNITDDTKYNIILAEDGSNIVLLSDPENQVILDSSGEQNRFVKWTLDTRSLTLYASDDSDNDYVFDSIQNNTFMQELKNASSDSLAQEFKNNIRLLSKEQVEDMFSRILDHPKERSSDIVRVVLHQALTDTNRTAINIIRNRLLSTGPSNAIASAGDEDVSQYGVWARSSINQSKDKVSGKDSEYFSSYKTRGNSNTIGVDGLLRDNLLIGAAYTNAYTSIRPKDQNIGNVDKVRTNMFSLYSAYNIPNYNWYLDNTVSYAESSVRGQKIRYLAVARDVLGSEVASSKYKSRLYSGSVSLGYNYNLNNNIYVTPSLGAIGSLIRDKGYAESGASFQNLTVRKKSYNKLTGVAGLRTYQDIYVDNNESGVIVTPEAYGFVNYNIKNKVPAIDARLLGIDQPLPTINHRGNRVDYNLGLGITIKQNMMEYGINYDANLAKKYQGHSGSLKVRVNL